MVKRPDVAFLFEALANVIPYVNGVSKHRCLRHILNVAQDMLCVFAQQPNQAFFYLANYLLPSSSTTLNHLRYDTAGGWVTKNLWKTLRNTRRRPCSTFLFLRL